MSIVRFFSSTVSLPLKQCHSEASRAVTRSTAGPSLTPGTFASGDGDLLLAHRLANCSEARVCSVPPADSVAVTDLQAGALVGDQDLERRHAHHVDVGRDGDLRRLGFEARPEVVSTAGQRDDDDHEQDDDEGKLAAGTIGGEGAHSVLQVVGGERADRGRASARRTAHRRRKAASQARHSDRVSPAGPRAERRSSARCACRGSRACSRGRWRP